MKKIAIALLLVGLVALGGQAFAEMCAIDAVPAATLLLPYFEVDTNAAHGEGVNTLFSINNASAAPALAHVTIWSNWSNPIIDFDIFLTGFDVQSVDLYDIIVNGNLPRTADEARDGGDLISPHGSNPLWDGTFPNCGGVLPYNNPVLTGILADLILSGTTGQPVVFGEGLCAGEDTDPGIATGYITIDNVNECSVLFPSDDFYYLGTINNINQLWGDWFMVDPANNFAQAEQLVHIEADDDFFGTFETGYTFYGRYTADFVPGIDNREPLGTTWAARYLTGGAFDQTDLVVWRDSTADNVGFFNCVAGPDWYGGVGLNETEVVAFNEREDAVELCFTGAGGVISPPLPGSDPACFPLETQRVTVGEGDLTPPFNFGWLYLNLNLPPDAPTGDVDFGSDGNIAQSYVMQIHSALGRYSGGYTAIELTDACQDLNPTLTDVWNIPTL